MALAPAAAGFDFSRSPTIRGYAIGGLDRPGLALPTVLSPQHRVPVDVGRDSQRRCRDAHAPAAEFLAGVIAGLAVDVPLHPLDTLKTRLQAPGGLAAAGGLRGLWSGLTPVMLRAIPCSGIFFTSYGQLRRQLEARAPVLKGPLCDGLAGAGANTSACVVRVPCEVLKQQLQAQGARAPRAMRRAVRGLLGGASLAYAGLGATVARELLFAAMQMPLFERLKAMQEQRLEGDSLGQRGAVSFVSGGVSGAVAGALSTPIDVVKTRMMLGVGTERGNGLRSLARALLALHREGGVHSLFRGAAPRTAYVGLSCALSFAAFECAKALLAPLAR